MINRDPEQLRERFNAGKCTPEELALIHAFMDRGIVTDDHQNVEEERKEYEAAAARIAPKLRKGNWPLYLLIAAASLTFVGGVSTLMQSSKPTTTQSYAADVNPGGNKAMLTLENGKKIQLSDSKTGVIIDASKLSYNDGTPINSEKSQTFTVSTPRGGTYEVRLPDGSSAWLNAASSITYSPATASDGSVRRVKLTGEAYFEVAKDPNHPFVVSTQKQNVTVLGTHFNINSYADERAVKTTLLEGSVRVDLISHEGIMLPDRSIVLKPGMQADNAGAIIEVNPVEADLAISWKNGEFAFQNESLGEIMKKVARWYDVEVIYEDPEAQYKRYGGSISKFEKISKVLGMLELTGNVKFKVENNKIIVIK